MTAHNNEEETTNPLLIGLGVGLGLVGIGSVGYVVARQIDREHRTFDGRLADRPVRKSLEHTEAAIEQLQAAQDPNLAETMGVPFADASVRIATRKLESERKKLKANTEAVTQRIGKNLGKDVEYVTEVQEAHDTQIADDAAELAELEQKYADKLATVEGKAKEKAAARQKRLNELADRADALEALASSYIDKAAALDKAADIAINGDTAKPVAKPTDVKASK